MSAEDADTPNEHQQRCWKYAGELLAAGYHLTPVTITRAASGRKAVRYHRSWSRPEGRTDDPEVLRDWTVRWPSASYAVVCGPSGVEGIDLDVESGRGVDAPAWWAAQPMPTSPMATDTPSGGEHHLWRADPAAPLPTCAGQLGVNGTVVPGVDVRGTGWDNGRSGGVFYAPGAYVIGVDGEPEATYYEARNGIVAVADLPGTPAEVVALDFTRGDDVPRRVSDGSTVDKDADWVLARAEAQRDRVAARRPELGTGYRVVLRGAALVLGRVVDAGLKDRERAEDVLRAADTAVWGYVSEESERWIQTGLDDGPRLERWRVRRWTVSGSVTAICDARGVQPTGSREGPAAAPASADHLPVEFWEARPALRHVRDAAWARGASPDAVLVTVLAREGAFGNPADGVDLGVSHPSVLTVFVILLGGPGAGKGTAIRTAEELCPVPARLVGEFEAAPLGSGEGMVEAYFGMVAPPPGPDGKPSRAAKIKKQVRENVLFTLDEGESLVKMITARSGTTIAQTIRSAWSGELLGQANASVERDRRLGRGRYSIGLVVGFQPDTIGPLFDEMGGGTPHRFLYAPAIDPTAPDDRPDWPGPLTVPELHDPELAKQWAPGSATTFVLADEQIRAAIRAARLAVLRGQATIGERDQHVTLLRGRVAAHLARWDGRTAIDAEDWRLAGLVTEMSGRVRDGAIEHVRARTVAEQEGRTRSHVDRQVRAAVATADSAEQRAAEQVAQCAAVVARKVIGTGAEGMTRKAIKDAAGSRYRSVLNDGLADAVAAGWITEAAGRYRPGPTANQVPEQ